METRKITTLSMLLALAVTLNIMESMIPLLANMIPGVKLGLANMVTIFVIYMYQFNDAISLSIGRVLIVGILRTGLLSITFFFSLAGAILSTIAMYLVKRYTSLSIVGVSIVGAVTHCLGQILVAIIILRTINVIYYLPILLLLSIPMGIVTGMTVKQVLRFYDKI
ncbi:MAG: Gx transporter family protein [Bacilli bacterium]|jgi:heptaprenyl diphosphate synthase